MKKELKQAIVKYIFDNEEHSQIINATVGNFREYVYTSKGEFLIGGEDVYNFIKDAIKLLTNKK